MKKIRNRLILAFMFLVMVQMACSCTVTKNMNTYVYEDLNGSGSQDADEPGFPNVNAGSWGTGSLTKDISTDTEGQSDQSGSEGRECHQNNTILVNPPENYRVTEQTSPGSWSCDRDMFSLYIKSPQTQKMTVGLAPNITLVKSGSPSTFSAAGQTITYSYEIDNPASVSIEQIVVTDNKTTVTCSSTTAPARGTLTCSATYVTTEQDVANGEVVNTAQFSGVFSGTSINYSSSDVSFTVTLEQVSAPVEAPPPVVDPVIPPPILSGAIGFCTLTNNLYYVNVLFASGVDTAAIQAGLADGSIQVQIAGAEVACTVDASNNLMTCSFPGGTAFPSTLTVTQNGTVTDTVTLDGYCPVEKPREPNPPQPPGDGGGG